MIEPVYDIDGITLYRSDCRDALPRLPQPDLILTDPQYQLGNGKRATTMNAKANRGRNVLKGTVTVPKDWGRLKGDEKPFEPGFLLNYPRVILWGAIHYASRLPDSTSWLIWDKRDGVASDDNADAEMAWSNIGGPARIHRQLWKGICRAGEENIAIQGDKYHPFQKPVALMEWCIKLSRLERGALVVDPYAGSGTTLVAAKRLGMRGIGIEIEEKYIAITIKRLSQTTIFQELERSR